MGEGTDGAAGGDAALADALAADSDDDAEMCRVTEIVERREAERQRPGSSRGAPAAAMGPASERPGPSKPPGRAPRPQGGPPEGHPGWVYQGFGPQGGYCPPQGWAPVGGWMGPSRGAWPSVPGYYGWGPGVVWGCEGWAGAPRPPAGDYYGYKVPQPQWVMSGNGQPWPAEGGWGRGHRGQGMDAGGHDAGMGPSTAAKGQASGKAEEGGGHGSPPNRPTKKRNAPPGGYPCYGYGGSPSGAWDPLGIGGSPPVPLVPTQPWPSGCWPGQAEAVPMAEGSLPGSAQHSSGMAMIPGGFRGPGWMYMQPVGAAQAQSQQYQAVGSCTPSSGMQYAADASTSPLTGSRAMPKSFTQGYKVESRLPQLEFPGSPIYIYMTEDVDYYMETMPWDHGVVGMDLEWRPSFVKGESPNKTALIQLCWRKKHGKGWKAGSKDSDPEGVVCLLIHLSMCGMLPKLANWLGCKAVTKVGVAISGDAQKLRSDFKLEVNGCMDLGAVASKKEMPSDALEGKGVYSGTKCSLAGLSERLLSAAMSKSKKVRCGNWEKFPLSEVQKSYAALDAYASLRIYEELMKLPTKPKSEPAMPCSLALPFVSPDSSRDPGSVQASAKLGLLQPSKLKVYNLFMGDAASDGSPKTLMEVAAEASIKLDTVRGYLADAIIGGYGYDWNRCDLPEVTLRTIAALVRELLLSKESRSQNQGKLAESGLPLGQESPPPSSVADENSIVNLVSPQKSKATGKGAVAKSKVGSSQEPLEDMYKDLGYFLTSLGVKWDGEGIVDLRAHLKRKGVGHQDFKSRHRGAITVGQIALALAHLSRMVAACIHKSGSDASHREPEVANVDTTLKESPVPNVVSPDLKSRPVCGVWTHDQMLAGVKGVGQGVGEQGLLKPS